MTSKTIGILGPGDMGHAVGRALRDRSYRPLTCLAGRSSRTRKLAAAAGFDDSANLAALVDAADLVLAILPPAAAEGLAGNVATAMAVANAFPPYVDCNAVSPATVRAIGDVINAVGAPFIDAGIIGLAPGKDTPRFYVSGPDTDPMEALDGCGFTVRPIGAEIGRASGLKMCYAGLTKGTWTLQTSVLMAAEALGLSAELKEEFAFSQQAQLAIMEARVPRLPADSERWIGEMEEIAATFRDAHVTPAFHDGAAEVFRLLARTPFAQETRETMDSERTLEEAVRVYVEQLGRKEDGKPR